MNLWVECIEPVLQHLQHPPVAGLCGALLSLKFSPGRSFGDLGFSFFCGLVCAFYVAPLLMELLNIYSAPGKMAFALVTGLLSPNLTIKGMDWIRRSDFWTVVDALRGRVAR